MSQPPWDCIPLLALKCVYEHMELTDALAAACTCRHWRSALLMYEGKRNCLQLQVHEATKKHEMLARIFKKHLRKLHVYITESNEVMLNNFTLNILPQFLDSVNLQEVIFVGPIYMSQNKSTPYVQLRRVIFETLVYKHAHVLEKLAVFGCEINHLDEDDRYASKNMAYYSKPLLFEALEYLSPAIPENSILSRSNVNTMKFCNIKHILFEFELITTNTLITLSELDNLRVLSLNIMSRKNSYLPEVEWTTVTPLFRHGLQVAVNIIALPPNKVQHVIDNAFRSGMPLTSLKVMFCRIFYLSLVHHVTALYHKTLAEFSWVDRPSRGDRQKRSIKLPDRDVNAPYNYVNPFIFLAWQCKRLKKLTVHGYWMCEYDLIGITRLRDVELDVSAIYDSRASFMKYQESSCLYRVMDPPIQDHLKARFPRGTINPRNTCAVPPALRASSTRAERAHYILHEIMHPYTGT